MDHNLSHFRRHIPFFALTIEVCLLLPCSSMFQSFSPSLAPHLAFFLTRCSRFWHHACRVISSDGIRRGRKIHREACCQIPRDISGDIVAVAPVQQSR